MNSRMFGSLFYSYELFESLSLEEQGFYRRGKTGDTEFCVNGAIS